jgi:hypothetical protein
MLAFDDGPDRITAAPPSERAATYAVGESEALGVALRLAAASLAHEEPAIGASPFLLADTAADTAADAPESADVGAFLRAVASYMRALRAGGSSPEQAVVAVKRHLQVALGASADPRRVNAWLAHAVTWGIEAYYRDD